MSAIFKSQIKQSQSLMGNLVCLLAIYTVFSDVFGGVLRYILSNMGALFINNMPSVLTVFLLAVYYGTAVVRRKYETFMIGVLCYGIVYLVYATFNHLAMVQSIFGFYNWALVLLGVLVCVYEQEERLFACFPLVWIFAVTGVVVNSFVKFPWLGLTYDVQGTNMAMARGWDALGVDRLAGFSRASYVSASCIVLAVAYCFSSPRYGLIQKTACYVISWIAIYLTTSKTEIFVLFGLPFALGVYKFLRVKLPRSQMSFYWVWCNQVIMALLVIMLPLFLSAQMFYYLPSAGFFSFDSLIDRVENTWPDGFALLARDGNYMFGRGLGGIGVAQMISELSLWTYGDNMFVYILVSGGLFLVTPIFLAFFLNQKRLYLKAPVYFEQFFAFNYSILTLGLMTTVIDNPTTSILLGFVVARNYIKPSFLASPRRKVLVLPESNGAKND